MLFLSSFSGTGVVAGMLNRGAEPDFWVDYSATAIPEKFSQWGNVLEETSHKLLKKWAKLINRGINAVKKDVLSSSLSKQCIKPDQIFSYHNSPRARAIIPTGTLCHGFRLREGQHWHWDLTTATLCFSDFLVTWSTEKPSSPETAGPPREVNPWGKTLHDLCQPGGRSGLTPATLLLPIPLCFVHTQTWPKLVHPNSNRSLSVKLSSSYNLDLGRVQVRQWGTTLKLCSSLISLPKHREHGQCQLKHAISPPLARAARTVTSCQPWLRVIQHIIIVNTIQPM